MKPTDLTAPSQTDTLAFESHLPHAPGKVWRALTEPALLAEWLLPVIGLELAPGADFRFQAQPQPGWDGVVSCRMLVVEAERQLRYTWCVGEMDTVVTFTLSPTETGTRLSIVHAGFKTHQKQNFGGARYGWNRMGSALFDLLSQP